MYKIVYTNRMKKDAKLMKRRGKDMQKLVNVLSLLANGKSLPAQYKDHSLTGNLPTSDTTGVLLSSLCTLNSRLFLY